MKLMEYWPPQLREVLDFQQIAGALQPEVDALWQAVGDVARNLFIATLTEAGVAHWEKIFKVNPLPGESLEERRQRVGMLYANQMPYTYRRMLQYLQSVDSGTTATIRYAEYVVDVYLPQGVQHHKPTLEKTLRAMLPANMEIHFSSGYALEAHAGAAQAHNYAYFNLNRKMTWTMWNAAGKAWAEIDDRNRTAREYFKRGD